MQIFLRYDHKFVSNNNKLQFILTTEESVLTRVITVQNNFFPIEKICLLYSIEILKRMELRKQLRILFNPAAISDRNDNSMTPQKED